MEHGDLPIQEHEHALIEKDKLIKAIEAEEYSVYRKADMIEIVNKIMPYTTVERINGLKHTAEIGAAQYNATNGRVAEIAGDVRRAEREKREVERKLAYREAQYSSLKDRMWQVKADNARMRKLLKMIGVDPNEG